MACVVEKETRVRVMGVGAGCYKTLPQNNGRRGPPPIRMYSAPQQSFCFFFRAGGGPGDELLVCLFIVHYHRSPELSQFEATRNCGLKLSHLIFSFHSEMPWCFLVFPTADCRPHPTLFLAIPVYIHYTSGGKYAVLGTRNIKLPRGQNLLQF